VPTFLIGDLMRRAIVPHETFALVTAPSARAWRLVVPDRPGRRRVVDWFRHMTCLPLPLAIGLIRSLLALRALVDACRARQPYVSDCAGEGPAGAPCCYPARTPELGDPFTVVALVESAA